MDYRRLNDICYLRIDKGENVIEQILNVCRKEHIPSATFSGIGGCSHAALQTFIPEKGEFETHHIDGMLELVSLMGNIICEDGELIHHAHAAFAYKEGSAHKMAGGHLKETTVLYTAEIEIRPVNGGVIRKLYDPETKTGFWAFE
ncbi:MAG: DNA-binding protein [Clostridia bacterium]|nr:DNA-binding protein [Clostridia bacterium]